MFYQNIETDRLLMRNISYEDRAFILREFSDKYINEFLFDEEPMTSIDEADALIDFYTIGEPKDRHRWIIIDKSKGEKLGTCGFHCLNESDGTVDIGYELMRDYWGMGYMTEALTAILSSYLPKLRISKVFAHIAVGNVRSERLVERLGFVRSGENETLSLRGKEYLHNIWVLSIVDG